MSFEVIYQLTDEQAADLHRMYQSQWWTKGRQLSDVQRMLQHSEIIVAFCDSESKQLVAFSRVLTDYVYKALVLDVVVDTSYRGKGLGHDLMEAIINHPALKPVKHFELYCLPEMMPFYQKWGFSDNLDELRFMRWTR